METLNWNILLQFSSKDSQERETMSAEMQVMENIFRTRKSSITGHI